MLFAGVATHFSHVQDKRDDIALHEAQLAVGLYFMKYSHMFLGTLKDPPRTTLVKVEFAVL